MIREAADETRAPSIGALLPVVGAHSANDKEKPHAAAFHGAGTFIGIMNM